MAMNKRTKRATESLAFLGVTAAIVVVLNILGVFTFGRVDVTERRLFSLSERLQAAGAGACRRPRDHGLLHQGPAAALQRDRALRARPARGVPVGLQGQDSRCKFVNPDSDEGREVAETDGVQRVAHQKIENDAVQVVEGYRGHRLQVPR